MYDASVRGDFTWRARRQKTLGKHKDFFGTLASREVVVANGVKKTRWTRTTTPLRCTKRGPGGVRRFYQLISCETTGSVAKAEELENKVCSLKASSRSPCDVGRTKKRTTNESSRVYKAFEFSRAVVSKYNAPPTLG